MGRGFMEEDKGISSSHPLKTFSIAERIDSVLLRFLISGAKPMIQHSNADGLGNSSSTESPLSWAENLKTKPTPSVNVEEDVLAIDGITVEPLVGVELTMSASLDSDGFSELERQFSQEKLELVPAHFPMRDKTEGNICREFAVTGRCSLGPRCPSLHQPPFPAGPPPIEVERPALFVPSPRYPLLPPPNPAPRFLQPPPPLSPRAFFQPRLKEKTCWVYATYGQCPRGPRCGYSHPPRTHGTPSPSTRTAALPPRPPPRTAPYSTPEDAAAASTIASTTTPHAATNTPATARSTTNTDTTPTPVTAATTTTADAKADWSPMDDGIEVRLPGSSSDNSPSREDVNTYIDRFLYEPNRPRRRRLPVFQDICPDSDTDTDADADAMKDH